MVNVDVDSKAFYRIAIVVVLSLILTTSPLIGYAESGEPTELDSDEISLQWEVTQTNFVPGVAIFLQGSLTSKALSNRQPGQGVPGQRIEIEIVLHLEGGVTQTQIPTYQAVTGSNGQFTARPRLTFPTTHTVVAHYRPAGQNNDLRASSSTLTVVPATRTLTINFPGKGFGDVVFEGIKCDPVCSTLPTTILCFSTCTHSLLAGTDVNLSPRPSPTSAFMAWTEFCQPGERVCKVHLESDANVRARFDESSLGIAAGANHTCIISPQRTVKCWGSNESGQLGDGTTTHSSEGVTVLGVNNALALTAGNAHTCALIAGGTMKCWGAGSDGQLGNGALVATSTAVDVIGLEGVVEAAAGSKHTCALLVSGIVGCWGEGGRGQLGTGNTQTSLEASEVATVSGVKKIGSGADHTCAVLANGAVRCWGANESGQLGDGSSQDRLVPVTASVVSATAVDAGRAHTCVRVANGTISCWGAGGKGQLGNGHKSDRMVPITVKDLGSAADIAVGEDHSCALAADGTATCWGDNQDGQVGDDSATNRPTPTQVIGLQGGVDLALGGRHTCAVVGDGGKHCWGLNSSGQLGIGSTEPRSHPDVASLALRDKQLGAGEAHACGLLADGGLRCWGRNSDGQLGDGTVGIDRPSPRPVALQSAALSLAAGAGHNCALLDDGQPACWGKNDKGQLGTGDYKSPKLLPTRVQGLDDVVQVAAGGSSSDGSHTCALRADGNVFCWGYNEHDQIGNEHVTATGASRPVMVQGLKGITVISAGISHTCALRSDGTVWCWGRNNNGQLGDGSTADSRVPTSAGLAQIVSISSGGDHTCALGVAGEIWCWGSNDEDQLGDGSGETAREPVAVGNSLTATAVAAGSHHTCAITQSGELRCWGENQDGQISRQAGTNVQEPTPAAFNTITKTLDLGGQPGSDIHRGFSCASSLGGSVLCWGGNNAGQLGNGSTDEAHPVPTEVNASATAISVSAGDTHSCSIFGDGGLRCWGDNDYGQLGDGNREDKPIPVDVEGLLDEATQISAGGRVEPHTCALLRDATVMCWGSNRWGQVGDGSEGKGLTRDPTQVVIDAQPLASVSALSAGGDYTCALSNGAAWCWGLGWGPSPTQMAVDISLRQISAGASSHETCAIANDDLKTVWCWKNSPSAEPRVVRVPPATQISAGGEHTCMVAEDSSIWCWGSNRKGQILPSAPQGNVSLPPMIVAFGAIEVDAGNLHTCARFIDGTVSCWGSNDHGQLGNGTTEANQLQVQVAGLRDLLDLSVGENHNCGVRFDGKILCWGLTVGTGADVDLGKPVIARRTWQYVGPSILFPCDTPHLSLGPAPRTGDACIALSGSDREIRIEVFDRARTRIPGQGTAVEVGGVVEFLSSTRSSLGSARFCNLAQLIVPDGAREATIELYEGSDLLPVGTQSSECPASAPTQGTITVDVASG